MVLLYIIFSFDNMLLSNATWFRQQVPKYSQMRHCFDNMFQNAFKCDMVSTTCSKPTKPTNLPTYQPTFIFIFISCASTTLSCMHNTLVHALEGPGSKARTQQKSGRPPGRTRRPLFCWVLALGPGPSSACTRVCACTRVLCMHKK